jgi:DNA-binding transcriptional LysR family regulator
MAVRTGSFTAAAAELGVAQASVSELVRRMEEEFDVVLFTRGSRRLVLTRTGEDLLPWAEQAVEAADRGRRTLASIRALEGGVTTFGLFRNARFYLLDDLLADFHQRYPKVRVRVVGQNSVEIAAAVAAGTLEAGLVVLPIDDNRLTVTPLMRDEVFWLYATNWGERARIVVAG